MSELLQLNDVSYHYKMGNIKVEAVKGVTYSFEKGKVYAIVGRSGSGKTTLMSLMAGLDVAKSGDIIFDGASLAAMDRSKYRREEVGIIYQTFNLFPLMTALENAMYPMQINGIPTKEARNRAQELLLSVGLTERNFKQFPSMLSGGEQQRVAIARALSISPKLMLADEPTGNLDNENSENIIGLLVRLSRDRNCCVIIITHDLGIAKRADVVTQMTDGRFSAVETPNA